MIRNRGWSYRDRVRGASPGEPLPAYLARRYAHTGSQEWARRIEAGNVLVNGERASPGREARDGEVVEWRRPPWREPEAPGEMEVVYEDADLLAVRKPAGLPVLPGAGFLERTVWGRLREGFPGAAPVHRLGRWTSGLVLCGRNPASRAALAAQWRRGEVVKTYRALATGDPAADRFDVLEPIGPVPYGPLGTVHAANEGGKPARTRVVVLERGGDVLLAEAVPVTGRTHQIRIHLAAAGHPLVGDPLYAAGGRPAPGCTALPGDPGYLLHAMRLELRHPGSGEPLCIQCEPPAALRRGWSRP